MAAIPGDVNICQLTSFSGIYQGAFKDSSDSRGRDAISCQGDASQTLMPGDKETKASNILDVVATKVYSKKLR
eukprot:CAMPEP_0197674262 /NCGR_PEP_ID=MMETSP1338-20131121/82565_1 /TAXON_ID=43686 ORGANISM="Pelagodinium beii, Strain RCC1491" /NCGR_SAMPLE_ID=MMETSP1338 /ASSEMBLY_ACC=CAM_ASM_000754 /LENGTH=72 /DNA_ID=CAMNT_0043254631 /DNA_START=137 /DNA_END=351 /DNA_ORIENTATION=-